MRDPAPSHGGDAPRVDLPSLAPDLVETLPFALLITHPDGRVETANRRAHEAFGYDPEGLRSLTLQDLIPDLAAQMEAVLGPLGRPAPEDLARFGSVHWGRDRHGSRFPVDVDLSPSQAGDLELVAVTVKDLSGWGGHSRELFHPRMASMILASLDVAIIGIAPDGTILTWNEAAEELYGFTETEAIGQDAGLLAPAGTRNGIARNLSRVLAGDAPDPFPADHLTKHGEPLRVLVALAAIRDAEDQPIGASAALTPMEELAGASGPGEPEPAAVGGQEALPAFHRLAAHDLREPLRMVTGYLDLLERNAGDDLDGKARNYLACALDGAERMETQLDGLRRLSQPSGPEAHLEPTDLSRSLDRALETLERSIEEHGGEVTHDAMPTVLADGPLIEEVFQNLISNAIRFVPEDRTPRVHIGARRVEGTCVVRVEDNGVGIPEEQRDAVFIPFRRLHSRAEAEGEGLGLSICRLILDTHRGRIWVEDSDLGGAAFCFTLPAADPESLALGAGSTRPADPVLA